MSITVNLYYTGRDGSARKFAEEMVSSGTVDAIRAELTAMGWAVKDTAQGPQLSKL